MAEDLLFISAGDPSGDIASARVIESLKNNVPNLKLIGLGGDKLKAHGQTQLADPHDLHVIGFWEVTKKFFYFKRLFGKCVEEIKSSKPSAVILVDYPGFNLRLAKAIKPLGIPIIYYITPQVWAWGKGRIQQIRDLIDLVIPILPFEQKFYEDLEITSTYVGHYLLEDIPKDYIASTPPENGHLALLPGSRKQEIERMIKPMLESAKLFYHKHGVKSKLAAISGRYDYEKAITDYNDFVSIEYDNSRKVVNESELVLTASGTATLETGIIGRPMVIIYKTGWLTYQVAKNLITLDKIGLVNLVLGEKAVPELIQNDANPEKICDELMNLYSDKKYYQDTVERINRLPHLLGDGKASEKTAGLILEVMR